MNSKKLFLGLVLSLTILSCSKDDNNSSSPEMSAAKQTAATDYKIDAVSNDISDITDNQIMQMGVMTEKSSDAPEPFLPECVTSHPSHPTDNSWTNILTFDNCQLPNGNVIDGTLSIEAVKNMDSYSLTITYTFTDFHHNEILVEGTRTVIKSIKSTNTLQSPHPVDNISVDMHFTFPDGSVYHTEGTKTREMIDGYLTPLIWHDDVFSITGNWTTISSDNTWTATITTPLIVNLNKDCHGIVSGVITIVKNDKTISIDYGNGSCDNTAVITVDGQSETITIGKK